MVRLKKKSADWEEPPQTAIIICPSLISPATVIIYARIDSPTYPRWPEKVSDVEVIADG